MTACIFNYSNISMSSQIINALTFQYRLRGGFCLLFFSVMQHHWPHPYCTDIFLISLCSCCLSTFHNRINGSFFSPLSLASFWGVSDYFIFFFLLCRPKLLPEEERRRENMAESEDAVSCPSSSQHRLLFYKKKTFKRSNELLTECCRSI